MHNHSRKISLLRWALLVAFLPGLPSLTADETPTPDAKEETTTENVASEKTAVTESNVPAPNTTLPNTTDPNPSQAPVDPPSSGDKPTTEPTVPDGSGLRINIPAFGPNPNSRIFKMDAGFERGGTPKNYLMNVNVGLTWNKDKSVYFGYSNTLGKWASVRPPKESGPAIPLMNESVIALQFKDRVYGFSAATARWDELKITDAAPAVQFDRILVESADKIHMFSDKTGRWASSGDESPPTPLTRSEYNIGKEEFAPPRGTADSRVAPSSPLALEDNKSGLSSADLRKKADSYEHTARELLKTINRLKENGAGDPESNQRLQNELEKLVEGAVEARLAAQKVSLLELKNRIKLIEDQITAEERQKNELAKKRLKELSASLNTSNKIEDPAFFDDEPFGIPADLDPQGQDKFEAPANPPTPTPKNLVPEEPLTN